MKTTNDYSIEKLEDERFVIKTEGVYQDIDFINSGYIFTEQRAVEIRDLLIEQANMPVVEPVTLEQKIEQLEADVATANYALMMGGLI